MSGVNAAWRAAYSRPSAVAKSTFGLRPAKTSFICFCGNRVAAHIGFAKMRIVYHFDAAGLPSLGRGRHGHRVERFQKIACCRRSAAVNGCGSGAGVASLMPLAPDSRHSRSGVGMGISTLRQLAMKLAPFAAIRSAISLAECRMFET